LAEQVIRYLKRLGSALEWLWRWGSVCERGCGLRTPG